MKTSFFERLKHGLLRMRLHPIPVFVFHQVSDVFEPDTMWECDWTQTEVFKRTISALMRKYTFIPLSEVPEHLAKDKWRFRNYAALTSDDGWASLKNILPWLVEKKIPVTLFLNPSNLDGRHWNSRETEKLLTREEVMEIVNDGFPYISVASHGWIHRNCKTMTPEEFADNVQKAEDALADFPTKVPFYAFASGFHRKVYLAYLRERQLTPVLVSGRNNEQDPTIIQRHCIDGMEIHG